MGEGDGTASSLFGGRGGSSSKPSRASYGSLPGSLPGLPEEEGLPLQHKAAGLSTYWNAQELNLASPAHAAVPCSYFLIGFLSSFVLTPLNIFLVRGLDAQPEEQTAIAVLCTLPWSFKVIYGFISDALPIGGLRRKPYFILGWVIHVCCFSVLAMSASSDLSVPLLGLTLGLASAGRVCADVMTDALVVVRARSEKGEQRGQMQSTCYAVRFLGSVLGCIGGAVLFNRDQWGWGLTFQQVCFVAALLPAVLLGLTVSTLHEMPCRDPPAVEGQFTAIWETITLRAVWRPMAFVFCFNLFQMPNVAWQSFLQLTLGFQSWQLGLMATAGSICTFLGILAYKRWMFHVCWRKIYVGSVFVVTIFSLLQLCLIFGWNETYLGLPNYWFALGDDVIGEYIQGIQFLPVCIMYTRLTPVGAEASTYALLTTFGNIALVCASSMGVLLSHIWDVSNAALLAGDVDGLWRLTVLTSLLAPLPLLGVRLLPRGQPEQEHLSVEKERSALGGMAFLVTLAGAMSFVLVQATSVLLHTASARTSL